MIDPFRRVLSLKKPCADCPFVVANAFPLAAERREQIAESLRGGKTFSCHKTVEYGDGEPDATKAVRCFGAASVLEKGGDRPMQIEQVARRLLPDIEPLPDCNGTYDSLDAFVADGERY